MFAGIVKGAGTVIRVDRHGADARIEIDCPEAGIGRLPAGASLAVNGVCLTAVADVEQTFAADVSAETLAVTTLGSLVPGSVVNLEPSLKLGEPVDGHLVYGHVDAVGTVRAVARSGSSRRITFAVPAELCRYIATKGSVAVDGVSLTVNRVGADGFEVNVIPHTLESTNMSGFTTGTTVNIEVDMMARYAERLAGGDRHGITLDTLRDHGFAGND